MSAQISALKQLVIENGGTPTGRTRAALLREAIAAKNPLWNLAVDFDIDEETDLLGKVVTDLQTGMSINEANVVSGTLKYVTGYTGFSGDPDKQEGNYIVMHVSVPDVDGVTIKYVKGDGTKVTLDADGLHILIIKGNIHNDVTFEASKDGYTTVSMSVNLGGLTLEAEEE